MQKNMLTENVSFKEQVKDWKEAIQVAAKPLLEKGYIEERYIDAMIQNVEKHGPYIVIMPGVAMPHSHTEDGALQTGVSILKLGTEVKFPEEKEVKLIVVLSASGNNSHMELLSDMCDVFMDEDLMKNLMDANSLESVKRCFA